MKKILFTVLLVFPLVASAAWKGGNDPALKAGIAYNISADTKLTLMFSCLDNDQTMVLTYHDREIAPTAFKNAKTASFSIDGGDWIMIDIKPVKVAIPMGVSAVELAKHEVVVANLIPKLANGDSVRVKFTDYTGAESIKTISLEGARGLIVPALDTCYPEE